MANHEPNNPLPEFLKTGIYKFSDSNAVFIDPVRILNRSYTRFTVSPSIYYSRSFNSSTKNPNKRKRNKKDNNKNLNSKELIADQRHQEVRGVLLKAHESFLVAANELLENLRSGEERCDKELVSEIDFVELGSVWQAPLYEIRVNDQNVDSLIEENAGQRVVRLFDNLVINETINEVDAELLECKYVLPKNSCFYMHLACLFLIFVLLIMRKSDIRQIHNLIPEPGHGFNLIVIDPPWENGSAHQKLKYKTLPNRHFLSLPVKQLTHTEGSLVALWVTNREKLRSFVEIELFPKWGVRHAKTFYWLKVKSDGSLISELDLFHHRPYECLLIGFSNTKETQFEQLLRLIPDNQVFISVPGDYSRKPPIGELLVDYVPSIKPARCIELFSREMMAGWTCWGNEPLRFQDARYFVNRMVAD